MLKLTLVDANEKANKIYAGLASSVVSGWLRWECEQKDVPLYSPDEADIILLVYAGALDWLAECVRYLNRNKIEPDADKRETKPYVIAGGPCDAIPFTVLEVADALAVGEAYNFVRELLSLIKNNKTLDYIRDWISEYPHAIERSQINGIKRDNDKPWLLSTIAPKLASPDPYVDWGIPPIRSDDKVVRIIAEKGCHCKCLFCATTYRQKHQQNPNEGDVLSNLQILKARGERVQLVSNDPMALSYFRRIDTKLDSQSFTIMEIADNENRKAIIRSGVGIARFGVEGVSERIRKAFAKPISNENLLSVLAELHANKINTHMFFIVGSPGENKQDWDDFRAFYDRLARTIHNGICRIKFTTFVSTPPAPLTRFVPNLDYENEMDQMRTWIGANAASKHLMYVRGRGGRTHIKNVAEQLSIGNRLANKLVSTESTYDLLPTIDDAHRAIWEVVDWPLAVDLRWNMASTYARRMNIFRMVTE